MNAYVYGMTVLSTVHRLAGPFPTRDGYGEILQSWEIPGGEAGNAAILLAHWGVVVRLGGGALGRATAGPLTGALTELGVDVGGLEEDPSFEGYRDLVIMDGETRTVFGWFQRHAHDEVRRWSPAEPVHLTSADIAAIDPFLGVESERAATCCKEARTPYVTIDCPEDSALHRGAAATVLSSEYLRGRGEEGERGAVLRRYLAESSGLCVVTSGKGPIRYGRGSTVDVLEPYPVRVAGTLGAGDAFRAGIVYGLLAKWSDDRTVRFAAATAAAVCARGPIAARPPSLDEIDAMLT